MPGNREMAFTKATQCLHPKVLTRVLNGDETLCCLEKLQALIETESLFAEVSKGFEKFRQVPLDAIPPLF